MRFASRSALQTMCGIAGVLNFDNEPADPQRTVAMSALLAHRGPDAAAYVTDGPVALAHTRLSIVDLAGGAQPMSTPDGGLIITFNGEIFNHPELRDELSARGRRFATRSDTEVILEAYAEWGEDCVSHMNGQWAFAIWDSRRRQLFLSRDRMGIRPLYYTTHGDRFLFASEIKALFAAGVPAQIDPAALAQLFTFWVTIPPRTMFDGVHQLPPGSSMVVRDRTIVVRQYWDLDFSAEDDRQTSEDEHARELMDLLVDATRIRLRADVPVGAYLSGGLDSSAVAMLATSFASTELDTFSIAFDDSEFDERPFQEQAARHLGTRHHVLSCSPAQIAGAFSDVVWHAETPVLRTAPSPMFLLSGAVRDQGYKVVLSGEGADEVLGGYDIFKEAKVREYCARRPDSHARRQLLRRLYPYLPGLQRQPDGLLARFFHATPADVEHPLFSHLPRWGLTSKLQMMFDDRVRRALDGYDPYEDLERSLPDAFCGWSTFARAQYLETRLLLPGYILSSQGDRMAMAHGIEVRMPFLDYRVVEFAARIPPRLKMKALNEKSLLKKCMRAYLPKAIVARPKQPYRAPEGRSFFDSTPPDAVRHALSPDAIALNGLFDPRAIAGLTAKFRDGRAIGIKDNMGLVGVLSTQLLMQQFVHDFALSSGRHRDAHRAAAA
jgi:asparagine synthase (glutamine-hydrolysing)